MNRRTHSKAGLTTRLWTLATSRRETCVLLLSLMFASLHGCQPRPLNTTPSTGTQDACDFPTTAIEFTVTQDVPLDATEQALGRLPPVPLLSVSLDKLEDATTRPRPAEYDIIRIPPPSAARVGDSLIKKTNDKGLTLFPHKAVGRILSSGGQCSGTAVGPHLVLTAAHCVHTGTSPSGIQNNIRFQPGYPLHGITYSVERVFLPQQWVNSGDGRYGWDYAILYVSGGIGIESFWGIRTDLPVNLQKPIECLQRPELPQCRQPLREWIVWGYPGESPFTGRDQYSEFIQLCTECPAGSKLVFKYFAATQYNMTHGASGGPWLVMGSGIGTLYPSPIITGSAGAQKVFAQHAVNAVSSFDSPQLPNAIFAPQFLCDVRMFWDQIVARVPR